MSYNSFNIDDPRNLNSFLALIGGSQVSSQSQQSPSTVSASERSPAAETSELGSAGIDMPEEHPPESDSRSQPISTSPVRGTKPPPPTLATGAVASQTAVISRERIEEDGSDILRTIANTSNLNLNDSIYAPKNYKQGRNASSNPKYATMPARRAPVIPFSNSFTPLVEDKTAESPNKKSEQESLITKYQDDVIANFVRETSPGAEKKLEPKADSLSALEERHTGSTVPESTNKVTQSTDAAKTIKATTHNPQMTVTAAFEGGEDDNDGGEQNREHLKVFKSWGTPEPRSRPTARVRKIILSNLPADSDLTLVQSLVHGGAIESFNLTPNKTSAYVIFVNPDACDAFFNRYPNGIVFKNPRTRRSHVVYVGKGQDVDVMSSVLQAYLDCQASRVVRATGADEDWGMRALYKLAESKNRRVETIVDTYRDKVRTVIFRFTNIADAVNFRGQLLRDENWEMCNIQFMDDPVEKATGVHLEE